MKLFISYSHDDRAFANSLAQELRKNPRYQVWIDLQIPGSEDWWQTILEKIEWCDCCLFVMSVRSVISNYCDAEIGYVLAWNKPILPLMHKRCAYPRQLSERNIQYLDVTAIFDIREVYLTVGESLLEVEQSIRDGDYAAPKTPPARPPVPKSATASDSKDSTVSALSKRLSSLDILPKPFAWINIPVGKVTLTAGGYVPEGGQTFDIPAFTIAKYPVINAQFAKFVEAGGYAQREWWTQAGWQARHTNHWNEPDSWQEPQWNRPDSPVVGVSWFEAVAFCAWLTSVTGEDISLPTEQQWQRAAEGDNQNFFSWGNQFEPDRCNFNTKYTTPVTLYEGKGDSLFQVTDMSGNVWEWCQTNYDNKNVVLRGGSWEGNDTDRLRNDFRGMNVPKLRMSNRGFRLARS